MVKQITKRYRKEYQNKSFKDFILNKIYKDKSNKTNKTVIDNLSTEENIEPEVKNNKKTKSKNISSDVNNNVEILNENE